MSIVRKTLEKALKALRSDGGNITVLGSGLVHVPQGRLNVIPKIILEHHVQESERAKLEGYIRRFV